MEVKLLGKNESPKEAAEDIDEIVPYSQLNNLNQKAKQSFIDNSKNTANQVKEISLNKSVKILKTIPQKARLHYTSKEYSRRRFQHKKKHHPVKPLRGEIYNAEITENVGSELCGNHLVVIISNPSTNIFADKINVLPIEGDGNKVPPYLEKLTNIDMLEGHLNKDPSRVIIPEVLTIDKSRLGLKIGQVKSEKMKIISEKLKKQLYL